MCKARNEGAEVRSNRLGRAGEGSVVEVPHVQFRLHGTGDMVHSEENQGWAERLPLLDAAAASNDVVADVQRRGRAVGLPRHRLQKRAAFAGLAQDDVAADRVKGVLDVDFHQDAGAGGLRGTGGDVFSDCVNRGFATERSADAELNWP